MTPAERRRRARMRKAVEMRAKGRSVRYIAMVLEVHRDTVYEDLRAAEVAVGNPAVGNPAPEVGNPTLKSDSNVIPFERRTG